MRAHQGAVRTFLRRLTQNQALADDLAQITFIKAYNRRDDLRKLASVKSWLFQIAYRSFIDHTRKETRQRDLTPTIAEEHQQESAPSISMDIVKAMSQLGPDCRAAIMLNLAHGYSHGECADILDMPLGTVKSHIKRGKSELRHLLKAYEPVR